LVSQVKFEYNETVEEGAYLLTLLPHLKRILREHAYNDLVSEGGISKMLWLLSTRWKFKPGEISKFGKAGRIIVDCGVAASLQTVPWACYVKHAMDQVEFRYKGCSCVFTNSPSPEVVRDLLLSTWKSSDRIRLIFFSDDNVLSINGDIYNGDFATNDGTKFWEFQDLALRAQQCPDKIHSIILGQTRLPIRLISCDDRHTVLFRSLAGYLPSGRGDTTNMNNMAQMAGFIALVDSVAQSSHDIVKVYETVGHKISLESCARLCDMQFLKMSLVTDTDGLPQAVVNPGVVLRASGTCRGDLPGRGSLPDRARNFQHTLMTGLLSGIDNTLLGLLDPPGTLIPDLDLTEYSGFFHRPLPTRKVSVSDECLFERYNLTSFELDEMRSLFTDLNVGRNAWCSAFSKIYEKDYKLTCPVNK